MSKTADSLIKSILFDVFPSIAVCTDFGISSQKHFESYYFPIRKGEITKEQLEKVVGNGKELTNLLRSVQSNPHKDIIIKTLWDEINET